MRLIVPHEADCAQSNFFVECKFRKLMASARTAMASTIHMTKKFGSFVVHDEAEKGNYLVIVKKGKLNASPNTRIKSMYPKTSILSPKKLLPWEKTISAVKFKKKENRESMLLTADLH